MNTLFDPLSWPTRLVVGLSTIKWAVNIVGINLLSQFLIVGVTLSCVFSRGCLMGLNELRRMLYNLNEIMKKKDKVETPDENCLEEIQE